MSVHRQVLESLIEQMKTHIYGMNDILEDSEITDDNSLDYMLGEEADQLETALENFFEEIA